MASSEDRVQEDLLKIYGLLVARFGPLDWWPAESPFEVMVGAILTQNTAWTNVEKAIKELKAAQLLSPRAIQKVDIKRLRRLIRSSGYFNQKALKLKEFVRFFLAGPFFGSLERMKEMDTQALRERLLAVKGIGPETADSIILYALDQPIFVVDAYTRRAFSRLGFLPLGVGYEETQKFFTAHLPADVALYNDFHAQIVYLGKDYCRKKPVCGDCPLAGLDRCRVEAGTTETQRHRGQEEEEEGKKGREAKSRSERKRRKRGSG